MAPSTTTSLTVSELIDTLGAGLLQPLTPPGTLCQSVSVPVIYDRHDEMPEMPGSVLLLVGLSPDDPAAIGALAVAESSGASAAVTKLHGATGVALAEVAGEHGLALVAIDDAVSWHQLERLIAAVASGEASGGDDGRDLFVLADAIATVVDGAVAIEDLDRNVLAYSNLKRHAVDPLRRHGILARRVPDMDENRRLYRMVVQSESPVHFPGSVDGQLPRCAVAVRAGHQAVGTIWVIEHDHLLTAEEEASLVEASQLAAIHILRMRSAVDVERQVRGEWLRSLLDGHQPAPVTTARFGVVHDLPSALLAFAFRPDVERTAPMIRQLAIAVEQHFALSLAAISCVSIGQTVYVLFPAVKDADRLGSQARAATTAISARLDHPVIAAINSAPKGLEHVVDLRHEVDGVLNVYEDAASDLGPVASARDVYPQLLLRHLAEHVSENDHPVNSAVRALVEHDREHGTTYRQTLCAYFSALGDVAAAAKCLSIHPNTVRYRVRRAQDQFSLQMDSGDERLTTWLALRLASD